MDVRERTGEDLAREVLGVRGLTYPIEDVAVDGVHVGVVQLTKGGAVKVELPERVVEMNRVPM